MSKAVCERHHAAYEISQGCEDCKAMEPKRISTGIPEVDEIAKGGLSPGRLTKVYGTEAPVRWRALGEVMSQYIYDRIKVEGGIRRLTPVSQLPAGYSTAGLASYAVRNMFPVQELPPGASPIYSKEPEPVDMVITLHRDDTIPKGELWMHFVKTRKPEGRVIHFIHGDVKKRR